MQWRSFSWVLGLGAALASGAAFPQSYPNKPIRLIVPYAAGGGTDISARVIAQHVSDALGQPIIIDNRPGAGTMLGTAIVAKAAPDGYTLVYGSVTHTIVPALYKDKMTYDAVKDFTPISEIATFPFVVLVQSKSNIKSIKDLVAVAKASPGKLNYASVGNGTGTNLTGEMFKLLSKTDIVHVPYNGSGPAMTALLGGQVDLAISDPPPAMVHIRSGALRALAVTTLARSSSLPDVPTIAEAGVPGFDFTSWWGVFGPANLPRPIVDRLQLEFAKALQLPDVKANLASFSADPVGSTPDAFAATVKSEIDKFDKVVKAANIKLE
jgi:tripartite-type tricarboxylate transporter receptor subunit TctC